MFRRCHRPAGSASTGLGLVVAIDVIRALTTAAILLTRGGTEICVRTFSDARQVARGIPSALVAGNSVTRLFPLDLPNSPVAAASANVAGRMIVFCTVNGTRVLAGTPPRVTTIACSAVNVAACAAWILAATRHSIMAAASVQRQWRAKVPDDMWRSFVADVKICAQADAYPVVLVCRRDDRGLIVMRKGSPR